MAAPDGAVIQAGHKAGIRNFLCIVIMPWVARACLYSAARSPSIPSSAAAQTSLPAVTVDAPRTANARPAARKPAVRTSSRTPGRPPAANPAPPASLTAGITPSVARALLYQAPNGQTDTTIDRSRFENRPAFSVADVLRESPGISIKQGNGPRDMGISIRGSNARNGFAIRNIMIFDDGFPVTQPDGLVAERPDRSQGLRRDRRHPRAVLGALRQLRHRRRAEFPHPPGPHHRRRRIWRRRRQLRLSQQLYRLPARRSAISSTRCSPATRAATDSSRTAGSIPRP